MRITGGTLRGRTVTCPPGIIRPAMDRMRESFFSILGDLSGLSFLDCFTGSGCMGLEAYSRGAWPVRCVEKDPGKRTVILKNLSLADRRLDLSLMPVERFLTSWKKPFDLVFLDPPFDYPFKNELLSLLADNRILKDGSRVFLHYPDEDLIVPEVEGRNFRLVQDDRREYGRSLVHFYRAIAVAQDSPEAPETPES